MQQSANSGQTSATRNLKSAISKLFYLHQMKHQYRMHAVRGVIIFFLSFFFQSFTNAQTKTEIAQAKKSFEGLWVNTKSKRYVMISFDADVDYATVNDWVGSSDNSNNENIDAYKAFVEKGKLVMPEENDDHHAPYCEMNMVNRQLIYRCKGMFTEKNTFVNKIIFVRVKN